MALEDRNTGILNWLYDIGYSSAALTTPMDSRITAWESYVNKTCDFYVREEKDANGRSTKIPVRSCSPATLIDASMASLLYNEEASISISKDLDDGGRADAFLQSWLDAVNWDEIAPLDIEGMCDTGTVAWVLHVNGVDQAGKSDRLSVVPVSYDAHSILPLAFDSRGCTAAAFTSMVYANGEECTQVEVHRPDISGNYEILTAVFNQSGKTVHLNGVLAPDTAIKTHQPHPTFALAKLAKKNRYWPRSPMGVALFDGITDVLETVDLAFDSMGNDIILGRKMLGLPESMLKRDEAGNVYTPWHDGRQFFLANKANVYDDGKLGIFEYNPSMRTAENREALTTALQVLGLEVGFGSKFFALDSQGNITTAKQVASDNASLMRTLRRHEKPIRRAIEQVITAAMSVYGSLGSHSFPDLSGLINVRMGDSVIEDTNTMRENDRADVAAGLLEAWQYMVRWQGYTEADAKAASEASDDGIPLEV